MDYLRIGDNKLKITLTEEELLFYGMDLSALSYSSTETRRAFWAILDDAKHATGFDAAASKVSVQVYASRTGGCEMYIIGAESEQSSPIESTAGDSVANDCVVHDHTVESHRMGEESGLTVCPSLPRLFGRTMGEFRKLSDLLSACLALSVSGYDAESSAWQAGDRYYLYLAGNRSCASKEGIALSASGVISEFGSTVKELTLSYLAEHGICICSHHAVEKLGMMAN